jgi:hypothetical protein
MKTLLEYNGLFQLIATIITPIVVVIITIWYQNRQVRKNAKIELFLTLMANRKANSIPKEWVDALNKIDVVFQDDKEVITSWELYYESLHKSDIKASNVETYHIELLSNIANSLGYDNLRASRLTHFYNPQQFGNDRDAQETVTQELIRVLKNSHSYAETKKELKKKTIRKQIINNYETI